MSTTTKFLRSTGGNFTTMLAMLMIPIALMMGVAVDFGMGSLARSDMQSALDDATLAVMALPANATTAERQTRLRDVYAANRGLGTAALVGDLSVADNLATLATTASYDNPNTFMRLANRNTTRVVVNTKASKPARLVTAAFKVTNVMGWWDKTVTLYGRKAGQQAAVPLMDIVYNWNGIAGPGAGVGSIKMQRFDNGSPTTVMTRTCLTAILTACTMTGGNAEVDVTEMEDLYMTMQTTAGKATSMMKKYCSTYPKCIKFPLLLATNDPVTSERLFVNGVQQSSNTALSISNIVPCGQWSTQAWEDGGTYKEKGPYTGATSVNDADFFYEVQGKCGLTAGNDGTRLTQ